MLTTAILIDTGATINLISDAFVPNAWNATMKPYLGRGVKATNKATLDVIGVIKLKVAIGDLRLQVWFGVSRSVAKRVILGTPFYYRFVRATFPLEHKCSITAVSTSVDARDMQLHDGSMESLYDAVQ